MSQLVVLVSGCHSGPNPSPGLGIARSLRAAYPAARLIGRDFSSLASGLHDPVFDETWLCQRWDEVDFDVLRGELIQRLKGAWMVSGLDLEVRWLAEIGDRRILSPAPEPIRRTAKPELAASRGLSVRRADWLSLSAGGREVHRFCRHHDWQVWVKGPAYEARFVRSWPELQTAQVELGDTWGSSGLFVEAHVKGAEVSLAFAAHEGELLGCVFLEKRAVTEQGKVWGGAVARPPVALEAALGEVVRDLNWTGGGELEFVRDPAGALWLIEWNPRFPAWIHGATLAGINLPGLLLGRASGVEPERCDQKAGGFVRVVVEIPARSDLPLPQVMVDDHQIHVGGKHPSGMPQLMRRLGRPLQGESEPTKSDLPSGLVADLVDAVGALGSTPARVLLPRTLERSFALAATALRYAGVGVAYSIKTNPDASIMTLARKHGLLAEAISLEEIRWALACGWPASEIIYNGPAPLREIPEFSRPIAAAFADDPSTLSAYLDTRIATVVGPRLRPPFVYSRFGVPLDSPEAFEAVARVLAAAPKQQALGVSFHLASSDMGVDSWENLAKTIVGGAEALSALSEHAVGLVDFGGGWTPEDFALLVGERLPSLGALVQDRLGKEAKIILEPGKALVQAGEAVLGRVVSIRSQEDGRRVAILDAGINMMPLLRSFPHRLAVVRGGVVSELPAGPDVLLGPLCMEADVIAEGIALPESLCLGDIVAICDAGAYDSSMAYRFASGGGGSEKEQ